MNRNFTQKIIGIIIIVVALVVGAAVYYVNTGSVNTITVYKDTVEEKIVGKGIVTADFYGIKATENGEALFALKEGKLVKPGTKIATVYTGDIDEKSKEILKALNDKIVFSEALNSSKKYIIGDLSSVNRDINSLFSRVIDETNENSYENVYELKSEILSYNERVMELKGIKIEAKVSDDIESQIARAEKNLNYTKKAYSSPLNGMFSAKVSNYDELINPELAKTLTPKTYDKIAKEEFELRNKVEAGQNFCKIINNYEWYLVSKFKKNEIDLIKKSAENDNIRLRIINSSDNTVDGELVYVSEFEGNEAVAVIKSTKHIDGIWSAGNVEFELVTSTKTGIKIPNSAILEKDGKKGVYVIKDSVYKFIEIEPLLYDKGFVIVKDKGVDEASERSNVILYDFVVLNPKSVTEGSIAN